MAKLAAVTKNIRSSLVKFFYNHRLYLLISTSILLWDYQFVFLQYDKDLHCNSNLSLFCAVRFVIIQTPEETCRYYVAAFAISWRQKPPKFSFIIHILFIRGVTVYTYGLWYWWKVSACVKSTVTLTGSERKKQTCGLFCSHLIMCFTNSNADIWFWIISPEILSCCEINITVESHDACHHGVLSLPFTNDIKSGVTTETNWVGLTHITQILNVLFGASTNKS